MILTLMDMGNVYGGVVVCRSNWIGIGVVLYMVHMAHKVVGMVVEG